MKFVSIFLIHIVISYSLSIGSHDSLLDPGRITWPKESWVNNPIEVSKTNAGSVVSITISFRPSTTLSSSIIEVIFPSTFYTHSLHITASSLTANTDTSVYYSGLQLPGTVGAHGPIGIVSRSSQTGQIYDINYIFGFIATSPVVTADDSLLISTVSGYPVPAVKSTDGLYFIFTLTINLWKHDIIEIIPDDNWTPSSIVRCNSQELPGIPNQLLGPNFDNKLPCAIAEKSSTTTGPQYKVGQTGTNSIYIYGISQDVFVKDGSLPVILRISTFTLPGYTRLATQDSWSMNIWRWGTNTLVARYTALIGPVSTGAGNIKLSSWAPVSTISASDVPIGATIFNKIVFTNPHEIPSGGKCIITFSNVDIKTPNWWSDLDGSNSQNSLCYLTTYVKGASCTIDSKTQVTIKFPLGKSSGEMSIALLTTFSKAAKLESITTYTSSLSKIDALQTGSLWKLSSSNFLLSYFQYHAYKPPATNKYPSVGNNPTWSSGDLLGADQTKDIYWAIKSHAGVAWTESTVIKVYLPMSTSLALTESYLDSSNVLYDMIDLCTSQKFLSSYTSAVYTLSIKTNSIIIYYPSALLAGHYLVFSYSGPASALPYVQSNLGTFYECWAKATTGTQVEFGSSVFSAFTTDYLGVGLAALSLCSDNNAIGIPILMTFVAKVMTIDFTSEGNLFAVEIEIFNGGKLGLDINDGDLIPVSSSVNSVYATLSVSSSGSSIIKVRGFGLVSTSASTIQTFIATGDITSLTSFQSVMTVYYTRISDPSLHYVLYKSTSGSISLGGSHLFDVGTASTSSAWTVSEAGDLLITGATLATPTSTGDYIGISLPYGFSFSSTPNFQIDYSLMNSPHYAYSYTDYNSVGFIVGTAPASFFTTPTQISLTNIRAPYNSGSFSFNIYSATTIGGTCNLADATLTNTVNPGNINNYDVSCSPKEVYILGPDSADTTMTISVKTNHNIPGNGKIDLTLDSNWQYFDNNCIVEGLDDYDDSTAVSCVITGTSLQITGYASFQAGEITIKILHTFPPSSGPTADCVSSVTTYGLWNTPIDTAVGLTQQISLIAPTIPAGTTYEVSAIAYPNFAGAKGVDIFLTFSFTKSLPWKSVIYITSGFSAWNQLGDIKDYCWSNIDYLSCKVNSGKIELTISRVLEAYFTVQLYLDSALDLPANAGVISNGWQISSLWNSVTITSDSSQWAFKVESSISAQVSMWSINVNDIKNAGETASYSFNFSSEAKVEIGDYFVIQFPRDFDAYIGVAAQTLPDCYPNDWFLDCSSTVLGKVFCRVDHWYLVVDEISYALAENKFIDLTINGIKNPVAGVTGYFSIYQYDENEKAKAFSGTKKTVAISAVPNLITFKGVSTENTELSTDRASYFFEWYAPGTYDSDYVFSITFPTQYNLKLNINKAIGCIPAFFDDSNSPLAGMAWNNDGTCWVSENSVLMSISGDSKEFQSKNRIQLNIYDVHNPEWGLQRSDDLWDIQDPSAFTSYSLFSEKFEVSILNTKTHLISSRSYGVLHSGFLGYSLNSYLIDINGYDPKTTANKIQVVPGTQSKDIPIYVSSNWPLRSKSLKITPKTNTNYPDNNKLSYSSIHHNWIMWQMVSKIYFRVAADIAIDNGIYYIDWETSEVTQSKVDYPIYSAPLSFLVEVCTPKNFLVSISIAEIPKIYMDSTSVPIAVNLEYAPANDLTVKLDIDSSEISIIPSALSFLPGTDKQYFQVVVSSSYTHGTNYPKITFTLEGTDSSAYSTPSPKTVRVIEMSIFTPQADVSLESSVISGNEVVITVDSLQSGVLYWYLSCSGSTVPSFQELYNLTSDLVFPNGKMTLQEKLDKEYAATETDIDPKKDVDINSFFRRKHSEHCSTFWTSSQVIYSKEPTMIDLNFLMAGTSYSFAAYLDNRLSSNTSSYIATVESFTTKPLPNMQAFAVNFPGGVSTANNEPIRYILGKNMGVNPDWLISAGVKTASSRRLQSGGTTSFIYYVLYDRSKPFYDSGKIIANFDDIQATTELATLVGINPTYSWNGISIGVAPLWTENPILTGISHSEMTFITTQTQDGIICVSCTSSEILATTYAWQVIDWLDGNSVPAHGNCINTTAEVNSTLTVTGLNPSTNYTCHFTACNNYPLWPACTDADYDAPLINLTVKTLSLDLYDVGKFIEISLLLVLVIN